MALEFTPSSPVSGDALTMDIAVVTDYPFTIAAWVRPDGNHANQMIAAIQKKTAGDKYFHLMRTSGGTVRFRANSGSGNQDTDSGSFSAGDWIHVAAVADVDDQNPDDQMRIVYLNGTPGSTPSTAATNPTGLDRTSFAARRDSAIGAWLDGLLGYLAIWRVALLAQEVAALSHRVHPTLVRPSDLVAFWALDGVAPNRSDIGGYSLTNVGTPDPASGPLVARPSPARAGNDPITLSAAGGTPIVTKGKLRRPTSQHLKVYWYTNPEATDPFNHLRGTAPLLRIKLDDTDDRKPGGYGEYVPKEAMDAVAHRMCDYIEAFNLVGSQWAFYAQHLGNMSNPPADTTHDASLFRNWLDEVRGGTVTKNKGRDSFYSLNGRAAASTIASALGKSMQTVFQSRGLSSMLSPNLMEMFGDHEDRNTVESMLGFQGVDNGYFDLEQGNSGSDRFDGEAILAGYPPSHYAANSPDDFEPTLGAKEEENHAFSRYWRPILLMANEQAVWEAIVEPLRAALGFYFKASNYAMFSATNPAHPFRDGDVKLAYSEYNSWPKHYLDYGQFALYPAHWEWGPKFGLTIPTTGTDLAVMHELMHRMWWWNIRACRGSTRPNIPTIVFPGYTAYIPSKANPDHTVTVNGEDIRKGYEMLVRAGHNTAPASSPSTSTAATAAWPGPSNRNEPRPALASKGLERAVRASEVELQPNRADDFKVIAVVVVRRVIPEEQARDSRVERPRPVAIAEGKRDRRLHAGLCEPERVVVPRRALVVVVQAQADGHRGPACAPLVAHRREWE